MAKTRRIVEVHGEPVKETDEQLLISARNVSSMDDWKNLIARYYNQIFELMFFVVHHRHFVLSRDNGEKDYIDTVVWAVLDKWREYIQTGRELTNPVAWFCEVGKRLYFLKKQQRQHWESDEEIDFDKNIMLSYDMLAKDRTSHNVRLIRDYLEANYLPEEIAFILEYYDHWYPGVKRVKLPKDRLEFYDAIGMTSDKRAKLIERLKEYAYRDLNDQIKYRR